MILLDFVLLLHFRVISHVTLQAAAVAALARITVQDSRKLLPDKFYPSWIVFSQRQKLSCNFFFLGFINVCFFCFHVIDMAYVFIFLIFAAALAQSTSR